MIFIRRWSVCSNRFFTTRPPGTGVPEDTEISSDVKIFCDLSPSSAGGGRGWSFVIPQLIIIAFVRTNIRDEFFVR
jgi:hypothetical protein